MKDFHLIYVLQKHSKNIVQKKHAKTHCNKYK